MRSGDDRGTKFVVLTWRDLLGCARVATRGKLAARTKERADEDPTEVRQPRSSARPVKAGPNPGRKPWGSEGSCGRTNVNALDLDFDAADKEADKAPCEGVNTDHLRP